jgi:hypothetical protein
VFIRFIDRDAGFRFRVAETRPSGRVRTSRRFAPSLTVGFLSGFAFIYGLHADYELPQGITVGRQWFGCVVVRRKVRLKRLSVALDDTFPSG